MTSARILVVEDERIVAREIENRLRLLGYEVVGTTRFGEEAIRLAEQLRPDLILMDIRLEGALDGIVAAQEIRTRWHLPIVYLTAYADEDTLQRARVTEPFGYLLKPFEERELRTAVEMALYKHRAEQKLRECERRYAVTLASIGEAVIATDDQSRITFMNEVAGTLTGWPTAEAIGQPLARVFRIINEQSREPAEDPVSQVFRQGTVVGLANHTLLIAQDGREAPIEDSGAPIIDDRGTIAGVVLVFQDATERRRAREALTLFRALLDRTNDSIEVLDPQTGRFIDVNERACRAHGYTREEYLTLCLSDIATVPPDRPFATYWVEQVEAVRRTGFRTVEGERRRKDGSIFPVEVSVNYIHLNRAYLVAVVRDTTERKRAENALRESHTLLNAIVEGIADAVFVKNLQGQYLTMNTAGTRFVGRHVEEILGRDDTALFTPDTARKVMNRDQCVMQTGVTETIEETVSTATSTRTYLSTKGPYRDPQGRVIGVIGIARDITEQKRAEAKQQELHRQVLASRQQLQILSRRLLESQEDERRRVARELHDEIGQILTAVSLNIEAARQTAPQSAQARLEQSMQAVDQAIDQVRSLSLNLRPPMLDVMGLESALRWYIDRQVSLRGLTVELVSNLGETRAPAELETTCFRVTQEALTNIIRHAHAHRVRIELQRRESAIHLTLHDDGVGFDVSAARLRAAQGVTFGLLGMQERVQLLGGDIEIRSAPGQGTTVHVQLPTG